MATNDEPGILSQLLTHSSPPQFERPRTDEGVELSFSLALRQPQGPPDAVKKAIFDDEQGNGRKFVQRVPVRKSRSNRKGYRLIRKNVPQELERRSVDVEEGTWFNILEHPFNFELTKSFKDSNTHHSACIETKVSNIVGHGFVDEKTHDILDPLTREGSLSLMRSCGEDRQQTGNMMMEVIRRGTRGSSARPGSKQRKVQEEIVGLHHMQVERAHLFIEDYFTLDQHLVVWGARGWYKRYALYGDLERFKVKYPNEPWAAEIIFDRRATAQDRWYGYPDWLSATASIELVQAILQFNTDFFYNYGVPALLIYLSGGSVDNKEWEAFVKKLEAGIGLGQQHGTLSAKFSDPEARLNVEKLSVEQHEGFFQKMMDTLSLLIVSAHRVPPILAGIQIPGKLGANNELINAVHAFQALVCAPEQNDIEHMLGNTLGNPKYNGGLKLTGRKPFKLKTLLETTEAFNVELPGSMNEPAKTVGDRKDIKGSNRRPLKKVLKAAVLYRNGRASEAQAELKEAGEEYIAALTKSLNIAAA